MNELNTNLIEAAKEKFPAKGQLANILMDTLYMGKEAIYRRLRGEVPFTFQEAAIISKELGISLDRIAGVSFSNNAMFDINVVDHGNPFETYYDFLNKHVKLFHTAAGRSECLIRYSLQCNSADTISEARTSGQVPFLQVDVSE